MLQKGLRGKQVGFIGSYGLFALYTGLPHWLELYFPLQGETEPSWQDVSGSPHTWGLVCDGHCRHKPG